MDMYGSLFSIYWVDIVKWVIMFIRLSFRTYHQQHKNEDISELSTRVTLMGDADDPWNIGGIVISSNTMRRFVKTSLEIEYA